MIIPVSHVLTVRTDGQGGDQLLLILSGHVLNFVFVQLHVEIFSFIFRILNSKVTFHLSFWFYVQIEVWFTRVTLISFLRHFFFSELEIQKSRLFLNIWSANIPL